MLIDDVMVGAHLLFPFSQGDVAFGENGIREVTFFIVFQYRKNKTAGIMR